jgi:alkylation response protein AidB-like acyl-CoA dehydrogenase
VDPAFTPEQRELREAARGFLSDRCPTRLVRQVQAEDTGHSPQLWAELARGGWLGMAIPQRFGGGGADLLDLGIFYEESGRVLLPAGFYATMHTALLIDELGDDRQRDRYLPAIASGELVAAVAHREPAAHRSDSHLSTVLTDRPGAELRLNGEKAFVPGAAAADLFVVIARAGGGDRDDVVAVPVRRTDPGVEVRPLRTLGRDGQANLALADVRVPRSAPLRGPGTPGAHSERLSRVQRKVTALQALEMVGGAQRVLDMTVEHACARHQFGKPIGGFQAVQHQASDVTIAITAARLAALRAMWLLSEERPASHAVSVAKAAANEAYVAATLAAHQTHGGIGYVREHDLHLFSQRARTSSLMLGTTDDHLENLAHDLDRSRSAT